MVKAIKFYLKGIDGTIETEVPNSFANEDVRKLVDKNRWILLDSIDGSSAFVIPTSEIIRVEITTKK